MNVFTASRMRRGKTACEKGEKEVIAISTSTGDMLDCGARDFQSNPAVRTVCVIYTALPIQLASHLHCVQSAHPNCSAWVDSAFYLPWVVQ